VTSSVYKGFGGKSVQINHKFGKQGLIDEKYTKFPKLGYFQWRSIALKEKVDFAPSDTLGALMIPDQEYLR